MKHIVGPWQEEADKYYRDSLTIPGVSYGFYKTQIEKHGSIEKAKKYFDDLIVEFEGPHCILLSREYSQEELEKFKILL